MSSEDGREYDAYVNDETVRLLAELAIAAESERAVSTFGSNVGKTIRYLHRRPDHCILLRRTPELNALTERLQEETGKRQPFRPGLD